MNKLKPCPFCGGEARIIVGAGIKCRGCGVFMPIMSSSDPPAKRWNRRHNESSINQR